MPERIWHPISKLEFFVDHTRRWLADVQENADTLEEARVKPHVLADADVARITRVYTEQAGDLTLFEEQAEKWGPAPRSQPVEAPEATDPERAAGPAAGAEQEGARTRRRAGKGHHRHGDGGLGC